MTATKKTLISAFAALALGGAMLTSAPAQAGWGWGHRHYGGAIAAGVIGGLALGAIAASTYPAYVPAPQCYFVDRTVIDQFGNPYIRRVRVCE